MEDARAALEREVGQALALLQAKPALDDDAIHAIRQTLKRARAALRLLRDAVSEAAFARENRRLRDAARPLAAARDARVMLRVLDALARRTAARYRPVLARLRVQLSLAYERRLAAARAGRSTARIRRLLERSLEDTAHWRMPRDRQRVYAAGLKRIYEQGREALDDALAQASAESLHEWRKQVKYLATALALVAPKKSPAAKARKRAEQAAHDLGDDHDLAVLAAALRRRRAERSLLAEIERRRRKLQKHALKAGQALYRRSPERLLARLENISPPRSRT